MNGRSGAAGGRWVRTRLRAAQPAVHRAAAGVLLAVLVAGCSGAGPTNRPAPDPANAPAMVELTVFAAASLREALGAARESYEAANHGVALLFSFDGSDTLRAQLELGAPADLFASADEANPRILADAGLAAGPPVSFAGNRLSLVVPADNPAGIASPLDLARPGVRLVAAGTSVPITGYAEEMLVMLAGLPGAPPGFLDSVAANVVSREDNVRAVLAKVELGEADAGIVYVTDAIVAGDAVRAVTIPDEANVVVTYAAVVLRDAPRREAAGAFLAWLAGPGGQAVLARFGFEAPSR